MKVAMCLNDSDVHKLIPIVANKLTACVLEMLQSHETYRQSLIRNLGEIIKREAGKILAERLASTGLIVSVKDQDKAIG